MIYDRPSLLMRLTVLGVRLAFRKNAKSVDDQRREIPSRTYPEAAGPTARLRALCEITQERDAGGFLVYRLVPRRNASDRHVLYIHGGAYFLQMMKPQWWLVEHVIRQTGASVTVPIYPLAPEHDHRAAFAMVDAIYDALVASVGAERLIVSGDSAGGGFAVSLAQRLVTAGRPVPSALLLFAPWLDVTMANPDSRRIEPADPMLTLGNLRMGGAMWAGAADPADPAISPVYGPVEGLPPMTVFQGTADVLMPDARDFAARAKQAGIAVNYFAYEGAFHVFATAPFLPESKDAYRRIGRIFGNR